jgi:hypothetical protein
LQMSCMRIKKLVYTNKIQALVWFFGSFTVFTIYSDFQLFSLSITEET